MSMPTVSEDIIFRLIGENKILNTVVQGLLFTGVGAEAGEKNTRSR